MSIERRSSSIAKEVFQRLVGLVEAGGVLTVLVTIAGFLGSWAWFLDLCSHFRAQYLCVLALAAAVSGAMRRQWMAGLFALGAVVNLGVILPFYFAGTSVEHSSSPSVRAMVVNVGTDTGDPARVAEHIREQDPDFLLLEEIDRRWIQALGPVLERFTSSVIRPRSDNFGIALYSTRPLVDTEILQLGRSGVPAITADIEMTFGKITFIGVHTVPPAGAKGASVRDSQFDGLQRVVNRASHLVLLLGDLNATPWSYPFKKLLRRTPLNESSIGRGIQPTWPTFNPLFLIPIDHCLYSPGISIDKKRVGPHLGSDHYPLTVDFTRAKRN